MSALAAEIEKTGNGPAPHDNQIIVWRDENGVWRAKANWLAPDIINLRTRQFLDALSAS